MNEIELRMLEILKELKKRQSDKNEGLLLQTLLRTQRVAFTTLGSSRPLSSVNIDILL